ncbi:MAG: efflux RND transporter periplasmic adaptor subunit [Nitrospirae bacterium]|nr:MAG: efflux RND transporter periplasmic adaptor subunit [Nitrospirota bacterium]
MRNSRLKMMMILAGVGCILLLAVAFTVLKGQDPTSTTPDTDSKAEQVEQRADSALPVQIMKPQRQDVSYTITLPANVSPWYQATLYAKVPGYLTSMGFDKGDAVNKGQLLAVIDAPEVEQQYRQAEADYAIKRITSERLHNVWKENPDVIAKQDVDVAEAAAEGAKHLMNNRRTMLDYTKVYAPFSGVITARFADPGALIQSGSASATQAVPLYTIMDLETVRVYVSVPQEVALLAKAGVPVVVTTKEMQGKEFKGSITRTTEALDPATRTLLVEIDMPNKERQLQPGTFVSATLYLLEHPNALVIPPTAIMTSGSDKRKSVLVVEQGKAHQIPIKTGIDDGVWVEVVEGLSGNEDIVVVGKAGLTDGQTVKASAYNLPAGKPSSQKY